MTTPSGEPYQYGEDTVAARLEVDVPADAISNLTELTRLTADLRANMEATSKYNQDYVEYLRQLPNAIGEVDLAQSRLSASSSSIFGGGDEVIPRDPFSGRSAPSGITSFDGQAGSGRPMRGVDQDTLINLARENPRQVANMAADRGLDEYFDEGVTVLPRQAPGPRPGAGREMQFSGGSRPPSTPRSPRSSTGPGDDDGRSAGTTVGRQVTSEGTESQAERAAKRLLEELDKGADNRDAGQRIRDFGQGIGGSRFLSTLNNEFSGKGGTDALSFAGSLGRMGQQSAENFTAKAEEAESQRQNLLAQAAEVAATNPALSAQLTQRAQGLAGKASSMGRLLPLAKGAGIAGAAVAGAAGINAAVQNTGETIHDFQGTGVQMGGGVAEGAAFEAQIRTMAMNPFISVEQSRKIMQSALQTGYTGKEMDTMTEFMAENLKQMNIDVAESTKLLQQNVLKGGQSLESVQAQLSQNTAMAGNVNMSQDQINSAYQQISGQLIQGGMGGQQAGELAQLMSTTFANNDVLRDSGSDMLMRLQNNPSFQQYFASRSGARGAGISASNATMWAGENLGAQENLQASVEATGDMLRPFVSMYTSGDENLRYRAIQQAASRLKVNNNEAQALLDDYTSGDLLNRPAEVQKEWEEVGGGRMNHRLGGLASQTRNWFSTDMIKGDFNQAAVWWNQLTGDEEGEQRSRDAQHRADSKVRLAEQTANLPSWTPEVLEQLALEEQGGDLFETTIVDEDGKERKLRQRDISNKSFMEKLQKGEIKVKTEGGGVQTLREWGNTQNTDATGGAGGAQIGLTDEARRFFRIEGPNPVQQDANQGRASHNSPEAARHGFGVQQGGG